MLPVELTAGETENTMKHSAEYIEGYNTALRQVLDILAKVDSGEEYTEHWYNLCKAQTAIENIPFKTIEEE